MAQRERLQGLGESSRDKNALGELRFRLRDFVAAREWEQFHSPKNLAIALTVEAGELLELFQWTTDRQPTKIVDGRLENVKNEIADIFLYLIRLADVLNVDLIEAANAKIELNAAKYPVEKSRGNASKYTEL